MAKRQCRGTTKKGLPCKAPPLKPGTEIDGVFVMGEHCRTHDPNLPDSARLQRAQPGAGRPKNPRVVDVIRERIEEKADQWFEVLDDARTAMKVVGVAGEGEFAEPIEVEDHMVRLKAFKEAMDRTYGRARQEITGADGAPLALEVSSAAILNDGEARQYAAGLRRRVGVARKELPSRASSGG